MKHSLWMAALLFSFCCSTANAQTRTQFLGQIHGLANDVKEKLEGDPRLQQQSLQLGAFDGKGAASATNFGGRIKKILQEELAASLNETAKFTLTGGYRYVGSSDPAQKELKILLVSARIEDERGKEIASMDREVNDSDDIFQVLGLTGARRTKPSDGNNPPKLQVELKKNNQAAQEAQSKPKFDVQDGTRVAAIGLPQWSMGIHKKQSHDGTSVPVAPQNVKGLAFGPVAISEYYDIELVNNDHVDVVATLTIDGLDVANTFSVDSDKGKDDEGNIMPWPGYLVPAGQSVLIRGWLHTIDQSVKDNLFSFKVAELGQGAASPFIGRGAVGVITVQFREACPPDGRLTGRSVGETAKGEGLQEKLSNSDDLDARHELDLVRVGVSTEALQDESVDKSETTLFDVFYSTNRAQMDRNADDCTYGARSGRLSMGKCQVSIPRLHRVGELESPNILNLEFSADPRKHVMLKETFPMPADHFFDAVRSRLAAGSTEAFVFVHGFNVTFEDAARRTAQLAYDLEIDFVPVFFSWPSLGLPTEASYRADELSMEIAIPALKAFFADLIKLSKPSALHIVAHSMGCRLVTNALASLAAETDPSQFPMINQVILAAPDIDAEAFREVIAPRIKGMCVGTTLYVSATDKALAYASRIHGQRTRLGDVATGVRGFLDIECVDATGMQTDPLSFGHSYYAAAPPVIKDISQVLLGVTAESRGLRSGTTGGTGLWTLHGPSEDGGPSDRRKSRDQTAKPILIGENVLSTISIRYNRPE